jgi:hypothetical protein
MNITVKIIYAGMLAKKGSIVKTSQWFRDILIHYKIKIKEA